MPRPAKLSENEVRERLAALPGWSLAKGKLHRELSFEDFVAAFSFMSALALHAEKADHHPEWSNVYGKVVLDLSTHDAGGITTLDFQLAEVASRLAQRHGTR